MKRLLLLCLAALIILSSFLAILLFHTIPQTNSFPHTQALLLHGYWLSQKGNGPVTLSLRSELEVKAAYLLYKNRKADYLFVPAGSIWGKNYPSLGQVMADRLAQLGVPKDKIILQPTAMDTYEEVTSFLQAAPKHNWRTLGDLAALEHDLVIPQLFSVQHASATYFTVEQVIIKFSNATDHQTIHDLSSSIYTVGFGLYELAVRGILIVDPRYQLLTQHARATRNHKTTYGGIFFLPIDHYQL